MNHILERAKIKMYENEEFRKEREERLKDVQFLKSQL